MSCPSIAPKWFWTEQIILVEYQSFLSGPNRFGWAQSILVRVKLDFSGLIFIIWTWPKWFGPHQNKLDPSKTIGTQPTQPSLIDSLLFFSVFTASSQYYFWWNRIWKNHSSTSIYTGQCLQKKPKSPNYLYRTTQNCSHNCFWKSCSGNWNKFWWHGWLSN